MEGDKPGDDQGSGHPRRSSRDRSHSRAGRLELLGQADRDGEFYVWGLAADIFLDRGQVQTGLGTFIGLFADTVMAVLIGVAYLRFLQIGRDKNPILKGLGFGLGAWLVLFGIILHNLPHTMKTAPGDARSIFSSIVGHVIFGLVLGVMGLLLLRVIDRDGAED